VIPARQPEGAESWLRADRVESCDRVGDLLRAVLLDEMDLVVEQLEISLDLGKRDAPLVRLARAQSITPNGGTP
jgi:hypothetical protein